MKTTGKRILAALMMALFAVPPAAPALAKDAQPANSVNLALGRGYQFTAFDPLFPDHVYHNDWYEDTGNAELTDGSRATDPKSFLDPAWTGFNGWRGTTTTTVQFDLGGAKAVETIVSDFYATVNSDGIAPPAKTTVSLSDDGVNWIVAMETRDAAAMQTLSLGRKIRAGYVKLEYLHANSWLFFDEIEVLGSDDLSGAAGLDSLAVGTISQGRPYSFTANDPQHPDYNFSDPGSPKMEDTGGVELTDGLHAADPENFSDPAYAGFNGWRGTTTAVFELQFDAPMAVQAVKTRFYPLQNSGITTPDRVKVSLSRDGIDWVSVKTEKNPARMSEIQLPAVYRAQYVKIEYLHADTWAIFDEIEIIGSSNLTAAVDPVPGGGSYDNLAAGLGYRFSALDPLFPDYVFSAMEDTGGVELTDGRYASPISFGDSGWAGYNGWKDTTTTTFQLDLAADHAVKGIRSSYYTVDESGIGPPSSVRVYLSANGRDWTLVSEQKSHPEMLESVFPKLFRARYVKVDYVHANSWLIFDEIEVLGTNDLQEAVPPEEFVPGGGGDPGPEPVPVPDERTGGTVEERFPNGANVMNNYMKSGASSAGIHDLALLYNQYYADGTGDYTAEKILPYLVYRDREGKAPDTMFDGVLFLALNSDRTLKVGDTVLEYNFQSARLPAEKVDFEWYLNKTFREGGDMDGLNEAARQAAELLGDPSYQIKTVLMVPLPSSRLSSFGEIGPLNVEANRLQALDWYLNALMARFDAGTYDRIDLCGLYWLDEGIAGNDRVPAEHFAKFTHDRGLKVFWIPHYHANGSLDGTWNRLGYDAVAYQPNHYFINPPPSDASRVTVAADEASAAGMGIEIENGPDLMDSWAAFDMGLDYLDGSVLYGYQGDGAFRAYYQWVVGYQRLSDPTLQDPLYTVGTLGYERGRRFYEDTYKMMRGTLKLSNRTVVQAPTLASATPATVTLEALPGCEYSRDFIHWQASPVFTGLAAGREYSFYQRVAGNATQEPSLAGEALRASTLPTLPGGNPANTINVWVEASAGPGGTVSPSGFRPANLGENMEFIITPDEGHAVSKVWVDEREIECKEEKYVFTDLIDPHTLRVEFAPLEKTGSDAAATENPRTGDSQSLPLASALSGLAGGAALLRRKRFSGSGAV